MASSSCYNQTISSSASTSPSSWDVFISFRGIDTRFKFTSHLYAALDRHAVRTFKDDGMLSTGELISDSLLQPIQKSKTYIVVLSENYASSRWCLDDLVEILKCCETMQRSVIPVFYNIDQSVVRNQSGSFKEAFEKHETRFDLDKLAIWRATLTKVGNLTGYQVCENMSEADIINKVVDGVLLEITPMTLNVAEYPVGLDSRVEDITSLLSSPIKGVIRFGIFGMGGVGKTTLAKAVYNHNYHRFQGSCFLANVREVLGTGEGMECLQQQLMNDVLKCKNIKIDSVDQGIELIRARICSTKVLIVIDDLDDPTQLDFLEGPFALGSIIIITTRNEDLLDSVKVEARYKVNELGDAESRQLFSQHAFGDKEISDTYMELSKDILECARGLPLALKVFGSNLLNQSQEGCICIDKLKRDSLGDVENKLVISFDALKLVDPMLQYIFLDIACFFTGQKEKEVVHILETCYLFVSHYIDILKKRCLLTINDRDELEMHLLLRDMGRKTACNNYPNDPGKHSRLWASKDISDVLKNHKGTETIEGIIPQNRHCQNGLEEESFATKAFKRMSRLRFLYLENVKLTGSFEYIFEDLRFLCWEGCPLKCLPSEFYPQELVTLSLPRSKLRTMWQLNMFSRVFEKLKTLNMSDSQDLITTPDFTKLPSLETLNLERCERLEEVHISIGSLARLVYLNLCGCVKLRSLPDSICNLRTLKSLSIVGCSMMEALPIEIGNIESLKELNAEKLYVCNLPDSIRHLSNLVELRLSYGYGLKILPHTICNLGALKLLNIGYCSYLEALPTEFGNIESLKELNAEGLSVSKLPDSIGRLSKLVVLNLNNNQKLQALPDTICNLRELEVLNIGFCRSLEALPSDFGNIESLKNLNAEGLSVSKLPDSIGRLSKLVVLNLNDNKKLQALPDTICNLRELEVLNIGFCTSLEALPSYFGNIESLKNLNAEGLRVSRLPDSIGRLSKLVELKIGHNQELEILPVTICNLRALKVLNISYCASLKALPPELGNIESLKVLNAECLTVSKLPDSIGRLSKLVELRLSHNRKLITLPDTICDLRALEVLHIGHCSSLDALPIELGAIGSLKELNAEGLTVWKLPDSIGNLSNLVELSLGYNYVLKILPDTICNLRALEVLDISGCRKLVILPDQLWKLTRLTELKAGGANLLNKLPVIKLSQVALSLKKLDLSKSGLTSLPSGISQLSNLEYLNLRDCRHLKFIAELPLNLKQIMADGCKSLKSILDLTNFKQLEILGLTSCSGLREIQGLEELTSIKVLCLGGCNSSLLACTFTKPFFKAYSGFGRIIEIYATGAELDWVHQSSDIGPPVSLDFVQDKIKTKNRSKNKMKTKTKPVDNRCTGDLQPKAAHNFLTMNLFFTQLKISIFHRVSYDVSTSTSYFKGKMKGLDTPYRRRNVSVMVIVPRSIFPISEDDCRIKLAVTNAEILGIQLLYETES